MFFPKYVGHPVDGKLGWEIAVQIQELDNQRPRHLHRNGAPQKDQKLPEKQGIKSQALSINCLIQRHHYFLLSIRDTKRFMPTKPNSKNPVKKKSDAEPSSNQQWDETMFSNDDF
uniref:Uncharacterized protein n=1 Tax=Romanomermis culicivorax TaxID=13658 RepID=A0A915HHM0_ROMCU